MDKFRVEFSLWAESQDDALAMIQRMAIAAGQGEERGNYDTFTLTDVVNQTITSGGSWGASSDFTVES
jgi:hypothetical protein